MAESVFEPLLRQQGFVVLDGGLATHFESQGFDLDHALWSARLLLATYGHLGRKKEATDLMKIAAENWTGHDPLNVRSVAFWYPFQNTLDAENLAAGLRKADIPD